MKRMLLVTFLLICLLLTGCAGRAKTQGEPANNTGVVETTAEPLSQSPNKTVATEEDAPKIFWKSDIAYHLENCPTLKEGVVFEGHEIPWSMVKEIGLRQCPVCNPPRYKGYVEAE